MARVIPEGLDSGSGTGFDSLFNNGNYFDVTIHLGESTIPFAAHRVILGTRCPYFDDVFQSRFKEGDDLDLFKHPRVFALADMFRIEELKSITGKKFERQLQQHWISDTFPDSIREVYSTSNNTDSDRIRNIVVGAVASHKQDLLPKFPFQELIREERDFAVDLVLRMAKVVTRIILWSAKGFLFAPRGLGSLIIVILFLFCRTTGYPSEKTSLMALPNRPTLFVVWPTLSSH
ncbi:hypothetical protein DL95DRAFT_464093 [Leptodontidium sp. 2 PMI_412]|nr:hypothetical protein DL95DRAFT_464093 [Leptodontidium sp. 2 PMI_412]